eukprot:SAG11_NODE_12542_length_698_cov_0.691152_1_plen_30_part_10
MHVTLLRAAMYRNVHNPPVLEKPKTDRFMT